MISKPIKGSDVTVYYKGKEKMLEENLADPYLVIKVPVGKYFLDTTRCELKMDNQGYEAFTHDLYDEKVSQIFENAEFNEFEVKKNQIVYVGDFMIALSTYVCLDKVEQLYFPSKVLSLASDKAEKAKTAFLETAAAAGVKDIDKFEFVSVASVKSNAEKNK